MLFEIRKKQFGGKESTFYQTEMAEYIPPDEQIRDMESAGYLAYKDGKRYRPRKVSE